MYLLFYKSKYTLLIFIVWKVSVFGVTLVRIFPHSDCIRTDIIFLCIQSGCEKIRTRRTTNTVSLFTQWLPVVFIAFEEHDLVQKFCKLLANYSNTKNDDNFLYSLPKPTTASVIMMYCVRKWICDSPLIQILPCLLGSLIMRARKFVNS